MPISIHIRGGQVDGNPVQQAVEEAFDTLREADVLFSTYRADSQVSRIRRGDLTLAQAHPLVHEVVGRCQAATALTDGAFTDQLPDEDGMPRFDPTGLVKGWAAERAAARLARVPGHTFCLNAGGDVLVGGGDVVVGGGDVVVGGGDVVVGGEPLDGGGPHDQSPWRVGVEDPRNRSRIAHVVELDHGSVATSGTAARGAHLYDPATASFVERQGSITVVGPNLMWADVWATALFVGPLTLRDRFAQIATGYRVIPL